MKLYIYIYLYNLFIEFLIKYTPYISFNELYETHN